MNLLWLAVRSQILASDPEEDLRLAFQLFAERGRGITPNRLKQIAQTVGLEVADDELVSMVQEFDKEKKGRIGFDEFANIMR